MKIFVGNLSFQAKNEDLHNLFSQFGQVESVNILMERTTGRSRGFGFVEMKNNDEAEAAISSLNGKDFLGRAITVNEARPNPSGDRPSRQSRY